MYDVYNPAIFRHSSLKLPRKAVAMLVTGSLVPWQAPAAYCTWCSESANSLFINHAAHASSHAVHLHRYWQLVCCCAIVGLKNWS